MSDLGSNELYKAGRHLRAFLRGLVGDDSAEDQPAASIGTTLQATEPARLAWGPRVDHRNIKDLYGPQEIRKFTPTPAGIDNLSLQSVDTFYMPGRGEIEVSFDGYFKVARGNPSTKDWATAEIYVNMIDIRLQGESREVGPIAVSINPDVVSAGQVMPSGQANASSQCRIAAAVNFDLPQMGVSAFNKEPILLMNNSIDSVPPVEDPNGKAHIYRLPLFDRRNPDGKPIAYLTSLRYTVGNYMSREAVAKVIQKNNKLRGAMMQ